MQLSLFMEVSRLYLIKLGLSNAVGNIPVTLQAIQSSHFSSASACFASFCWTSKARSPDDWVIIDFSADDSSKFELE